MTRAPSPAALHTLTAGSSGPRIAFLHGLFGQGRNWQQIAKGVVGEGGSDARALMIDLPDHGRSPWTDDFSYETYAARVADTISAWAGDEPVTLVGHSLGGKTAMIAALQHPACFEKLCVVDIAPRSYHNLHRFAGYIAGMQALPLEELTSRRDAEERFAQVEPDPGVAAFLLQNLRRAGDSWAWQCNLQLVARDAARGSASRIADFPYAVNAGDPLPAPPPFGGPTVWLAGSGSGYVADDDTERMRELFPAVRKVTVKGAGHWVHTDAPQVVIETLRRLLAVR